MSETATQSGDTPTTADNSGSTESATGTTGGKAQDTQHDQATFDRAYARAATKFESKIEAANKQIAELQSQLQTTADAEKTAEELRAEIENERKAREEYASKLETYESAQRARIESRAETLDESDRELVGDLLDDKKFDKAERLIERLSAKSPPTSSQHQTVTQNASKLSQADIAAARAKGPKALAELKAQHTQEEWLAAFK